MTDKACELGGSTAARRYRREFGIAMTLYVASVFLGGGSVVFIAVNEHPDWLRIPFALLPLVPSFMALRAYLTFYRDMDELQRRINSEAIIIATGVVGMGSFAYGFLESWAKAPHVPLIWVMPAIIAAWGFALAIVTRRYK